MSLYSAFRIATWTAKQGVEPRQKEQVLGPPGLFFRS